MCIRDSQAGTLADIADDVHDLRFVGLGAALVDDCQVEIVAVSYTHLRAHETVLDLVCRLLLEKKKIQM